MADGESTALVRGGSGFPSTEVILGAPLPERYEAAKRAVAFEADRKATARKRGAK